MDRIARAVEPSLGYRHELPHASDEPTVGQAMSNAACDIAEALGAKAILVPTFTGRTASAVARLRPRRPIIALTHHDYALRQMALEWGVIPLLDRGGSDVEDLWSRSLEAARGAGSWRGDRVVITAGTAVNMPARRTSSRSSRRKAQDLEPLRRTREAGWPVARRNVSRADGSCSAGSEWGRSRSSRSSTGSRCGATCRRVTRSRSSPAAGAHAAGTEAAARAPARGVGHGSSGDARGAAARVRRARRAPVHHQGHLSVGVALTRATTTVRTLASKRFSETGGIGRRSRALPGGRLRSRRRRIESAGHWPAPETFEHGPTLARRGRTGEPGVSP